MTVFSEIVVESGVIAACGAAIGFLVYAGFLSTYLAKLKLLDPHDAGDTVLVVLIVAWVADTGGYFAGRFLGKRKLYEAVSPKKTWAGAWGGLASGIFGSKALGGLGGVAFMSQLAGTLLGIGVAVAGATIVYGVLKKVVGLRLDPEAEWNGADLTIHRISATAERETSW